MAASDSSKQSAQVGAAAEQLRATLRRVGSWLMLLIPLGALGYIVLQLIAPADPALRRPETFLKSYSDFVMPYTSGAAVNSTALDQWLEFFDESSRDFFEEHVPRMALRQLYNDSQALGALSRDQQRIEAFRFVIQQAPLNGKVVLQRAVGNPAGDGAMLNVTSGAREMTMHLVREGGQLRISRMSSLLSNRLDLQRTN